MSLQAVDEETPLLQAQTQKKAKTPLPWRSLSIILFLRFAEPLTSQVIAPFAPQLIRDIGVTNGDETKVGYYVGLLHSSFFVMEALTVLHWGRLSDHIGRRPVILTGLFGLCLSMYCFGLSKTFSALIISRCLNGALNGNIGVIKSTVADITDSTNIAEAFAYMSVIWSTGVTVGPFIGGLLSKPADQFPGVFSRWEFFKIYPYFLACAVPATFTIIAWIATYLFLKETLPHCIPLGQLIKAKLNWQKSPVKNISTAPETLNETSANGNIEESRTDNETPLPFRALLVPRVLIAAGNYGTLSLLDIAFRVTQPLFFSTPVELGGLGLDPPQIGIILSVYGVVNGLFLVFFLGNLHSRFGPKNLYHVATAAGIPIILAFPLTNALARTQGLSWMVWLCVGIQSALFIVFNMGFSCVFVYITAASPNRASLGGTNGIAQLLVSVMRAIGPASATSMFSVSIGLPTRAWFVYYYLLFLVWVSIGAGLLLPRRVWNRSTDGQT